jgi:hypothetical protein
MAALVQQTAAFDAGGSSGTRALTATAGSLLVATIVCRDGTDITGVSDTVNGAWSVALKTGASSGRRAAIYYRMNSGAGSLTVTVTLAASETALSFAVSEWSGIATTSALDQSNEATNFGATSHSHGSITTTGAGVIITSAGLNSNLTETVAGGFTEINNGSRAWAQYKISSGVETTTGAFTTAGSGDSTTVIANFLNASGGGGGSGIPRFMAINRRRRAA